MIPHPAWFAGSHRQRVKRATEVYEQVQRLIRRTALFQLGSHTHLRSLDNQWRTYIVSLSDQELTRQFERILEAWPARRIRS
jgi:hypothetical protein